ncbi:MAG: hypothetical protein PHG51_06360 [Candidatus Omnitrophica bacterium]|nr:hypothetical protein [Candidatus Omnitrophota bacterium]
MATTAGMGGTVSPSGTVQVAYGEDQAFTITPDSGYHIDNVLADGVSVGAVTSYIFTDVTADHALEASFAANPVSGGGGGGGFPYTNASVLGNTDVINQNYKGETLKEFTASNDDLSINIPKGTVMQDKNGQPLTRLNVQPNTTPLPTPEGTNVIGLQYNFTPNGAQFSPALNLTFKYSDVDIPGGVFEEDLVIAFFDETTGQWVELECVIDTENNIITAKVSHFTTFAIIGQEPVITPAVEPAPEPTIAPTQEPAVEPAPEPTIAPTQEPAVEPAPEPTIAPTQEPASTPTETPEPEKDDIAKWIFFSIIIVAILILVGVITIRAWIRSKQ